MWLLPSTGKWTFMTLASLILGGALIVTNSLDAIGYNGKMIFAILWGTSLIVFQMIGFVSWSRSNSPQPVRTAPAFTIRLLYLNMALVVFGFIVAATDYLDETNKTRFFAILIPLIIILFIRAFHRWWKSRGQLQQAETGGFDAWSQSLSHSQQEEAVHVAVMEKETISPPSQGQRSRPVIVRTKRWPAG